MRKRQHCPPAFPAEEAASANAVEENDRFEALPVLNDRLVYHRADVAMLQQPESHLKQVHLQKILDSLERIARETIDLIKTHRPVYSSRFNDILKRLSTKNKKLYFCGGGCFHMSIEEHGSMHEPDDRWCQELRRSVELGVMIDDTLNDFDRHHLGLRKHRKPSAARPLDAAV